VLRVPDVPHRIWRTAPRKHTHPSGPAIPRSKLAKQG
jgi:hypothetical protein